MDSEIETILIDASRNAGRIETIKSILAYIRKVAQEGTADDEVKLTRLAAAIERGEHGSE